jgi:hypothetical protein
MPIEPLDVSCAAADDGWRCRVRVGQDAAATVHVVSVSPAAHAELAGGADVEELVRASFEFLLEREPREAIMSSFELPIIGRFFGDYRDEVRRRLAS